MTCREKLKLEHPEAINDKVGGGCCGCPYNYGYIEESLCICKNPETKDIPMMDGCAICWDQEIPETDAVNNAQETNDNTTSIKDSGDRTEFETGAVRDMHEGKGRCDLMPLDVIADIFNNAVFRLIYHFQEDGDYNWLIRALLSCGLFSDVPDSDACYMHTTFLEVAKHFEEGCKKYGENNWRKGIPTHCYVDSAVRHYLKHLRGDTDERHDRAFVWNILCCIWTCIHKPELNDYKKES